MTEPNPNQKMTTGDEPKFFITSQKFMLLVAAAEMLIDVKKMLSEHKTCDNPTQQLALDELLIKKLQEMI